MRKNILSYFAFFLSTISLIAQEKRDTIPPFVGITYQPVLKYYIKSGLDDKKGGPVYVFDNNPSTTYEGSFLLRKLRLGVSAQIDDNLIGKISRWGGYAGLNNYWIKIHNLKITGTVNWNEAQPMGFVQGRTFIGKLLSIELLKTANKKRYIDGKWQTDTLENKMGFYWGIGYISVALPVKLTTLIFPEIQEYPIHGQPAYDSLFKAQYYTVCFGFDLLRQLSLTGGKQGLAFEKPLRFAMYAATQDKLGFGQGRISSSGVSMAEAMNPGYSVKKHNPFSVVIDYYLSVGFRYYFAPKPFFVVIGTGYDLGGAFFATFNGNKNHSDLALSPDLFFINHGPSFRVIVSYIGK